MRIDTLHALPAMGAGIGEKAEYFLLAVRVLAHNAQLLAAPYAVAACATCQKTGLTAHLAAIKAYNAGCGE